MTEITLEELTEIAKDISSDDLKRYRIVVDVTLNTKVCDTPDNWDWQSILDLGADETIHDVFVEDLDTDNLYI